MIHDLWVGGWCWYDWATRFSNLGWECWAINLRGRDPARGFEEGRRQTLRDCARDLDRLYDALPSPAIILAHGFGASIAQTVLAGRATVAAVLLAPAVEPGAKTSRALRRLRIKYLPLMVLRQPVLIRTSDFDTLWLNCVDETDRREILQGLVPESPQLVRALLQPGNTDRAPDHGFPVLTLSGGEDRLLASRAADGAAEAPGREHRRYAERGHWMLHEPGWQEVVNDIHRWIVSTLGESVLISAEP